MNEPAAERVSGKSPVTVRVALALAAIYLPYSWILFEGQDRGYQAHWLKMWPLLPGLMIGEYVRILAHLPHGARWPMAVLCTILFVGWVLWSVRRSSRSWGWVVGATLLFSSVLGWIARGLFLF